MNKIKKGTFLLFKSEKDTDEGHLKLMREGLRNILFLFGLIDTAQNSQYNIDVSLWPGNESNAPFVLEKFNLNLP